MPKNEQLVADAQNRFKQMPEDILEAMRANADLGRRFYVPQYRATDPNLSESHFGYVPRNELDGWLSFREIRALLLVHNEVRELKTLFGYGFGSVALVRQVLGLEFNDHSSASEVLRGMADFVQNMGFVAGIRDMVVREERKPKGTTITENNRRLWWERFEPKIVNDHLHLGVSVSRGLAAMLREHACMESMNYVEMKLVEDYALGAELASQLYLADLGLDPGELDSASNF